MRTLSKTIFTAIIATAAVTPAFADDPPANPDGDTEKTEPPTPPANLPPPTSDKDPAPPVAAPPNILTGGLVEQAGVGGQVGYGRAGVLELGSSAGLMVAPDFRNVNISPSIGWFVADNLELSGIFSLSNIKANEEESTMFAALLEPSYHLPINRTTFAFLGMGFGYAHIQDIGGGLAVAPRLGVNLLVGRSGVLSPSLSYEYTTHDAVTTDIGDMQDVTVLAVSQALRINVGYTAMW
jgi:hypothetical protein